MLFLITENEVITLANEATLSIENKNQLYVRIILSINTIEAEGKIIIDMYSSI